MLRHKYGAKPTTTDGIRFASKLEAKYYGILKNLQTQGKILFFLRQVPFHLPGNVSYRADFMEFWSDGEVKIVDLKGCDTPQSKQKRKQVESIYPITIDIIKTC